MKKVALWMGVSLVLLTSIGPLRLVNLYLCFGIVLAAGATVFLAVEADRRRTFDVLEGLALGIAVGVLGAFMAFLLDGLLLLAGTRFTFDPMPAQNYALVGGVLDGLLNLGRDGATPVTAGSVGHVLIGMMSCGVAGAFGGILAGLHFDGVTPQVSTPAAFKASAR